MREFSNFIDEVDGGNWPRYASDFLGVQEKAAHEAFNGNLHAAIHFMNVVLGEEWEFTLTRHTARVEPPYACDTPYVGLDPKPARALLVASLRAYEDAHGR